MSKSRTRGRRGQGGTAALEIFSRPKQSLPVVLLLVVWRWRWELITTAALIIATIMLNNAGLPGALILTATVAVLVVVPPTRRFVRTRLWCVITRHRLRSCLNELRTLNYSGNLPFILHAHGTKVGESVWLWMRPGLSVSDVESRTEHIAAACWGRDARIHRSRRMAALVRVDIVRRDPLAASEVKSPLLGDTARMGTNESHEVPDTLIAATAAVPVHQVVESDEPKPTSKSRKATTTAMTAVAAPVVLIGGEDVSDYV